MTATRISEIIRDRLGWCPASHALKMKISGMELPLPAAGVSDAGDPQPGSNPATRSRFNDWFIGVAIFILFATCFFGGLFWWPFFVLGVLAAGLVYWYYHDVEGR